MLERKAYAEIESWKREKTRQGLLVMGAHQVGKTTTVREFARRNYRTLAEVNFLDDERAIETVANARNAQDLFLRISALAGVDITPGDTLVFLDEVQQCDDALTWLKFLAERTDLDYILSGSLLGLDSFNPRSLPVGFLQTLTMYPLDFEEFCWSQGVGRQLIEEARRLCMQRATIPDYLHELLIDTFYRYLLVGGMPDAVQAFCETGALPGVRNVQRAIVELYRHDMSKYVQDKTESRQIRMVYESIPAQLCNPNKRFKYTRLGKNLRFANLETAFDWLGSSGTALPVTRVGEPAFPLGLSEDPNSLKLYMNDVGLLTSQLMGDVDVDILNRKSSINFGAIFENAAAQELCARGFELHYYNARAVGEIDFVLQLAQGDIALVEVKSGKDYRRHSALNNLLSAGNHEPLKALVFCDGGVSVSGQVTYLPIYAIGLLGDFSAL